jgi:nitrous oxidase accessory protein
MTLPTPPRLLPILLLVLLAAGLPGQARSWRVTPARPLAGWLDAAAPGDTLRLAAGVYRGDSVVVAKPVVLLGEPGAVLDGGGGGHVLMVRADHVSVRGLTLRGAGLSYRADHAALLGEGCRGLTVADCRFEDNFFGIYLARCRDTRILDNTLRARGERETASGNGIHLWHCRDTAIDGNRVTGHRDGIYLEFVRHADIQRNQGSANLRYGLHFMFSDSCRYLRNSFDRNGAGVAVMYSRWVEMAGNRFHDNWGPASYGVLLKEISDSSIRGNVFEANTTGLLVEASNRLTATGNTFRRNGWALRLMANSMDGRYEDNQFIANSFDVATNGRQNYSLFRRNYWDRHRGYDLDRDGFADTPYRPAGVFSLVVADQSPALVLLRSLFVELLDAAERAFPLLTPASLADEQPRMRALP